MFGALEGGGNSESLDPSPTLGAAHGLGTQEHRDSLLASPSRSNRPAHSYSAGKRESRPAEWNIEVQRVVLQRAGNSHSMPMGAVVATSRLIECIQVIGEPDDNGLVSCRGYGELSDEPEYDATITVDPYGDFSVGRWLWVRVEPVPATGRQGVWTLSATVASELAS